MYSPTKHCGAYRREDDGSGGAGSGREAETPSTAPNSTRGAMRGHGRGRSRAEPFWGRRIRLDRGPTAYMYTPSGRVDGEAARPERRARLPRPWPHDGRQTKTARLLIYKLCQVPIIKRQRVAPGEGRECQRWCRRWGWSGSRLCRCRTRRLSEPSRGQGRCRAVYAPRRSGRSARRCC